MKFTRWRKGAIMYLEIHNEATTEELITKVRSKCGKLMNSRMIPKTLVGAANCLASDKRFVKVRYIKVIGTTKAVWGLKHDIRGEKYERDC